MLPIAGCRCILGADPLNWTNAGAADWWEESGRKTQHPSWALPWFYVSSKISNWLFYSTTKKKKMYFHVLANLLHITMLLLETDFSVLTLALQYISTEGQNWQTEILEEELLSSFCIPCRPCNMFIKAELRLVILLAVFGWTAGH